MININIYMENVCTTSSYEPLHQIRQYFHKSLYIQWKFSIIKIVTPGPKHLDPCRVPNLTKKHVGKMFKNLLKIHCTENDNIYTKACIVKIMTCKNHDTRTKTRTRRIDSMFNIETHRKNVIKSYSQEALHRKCQFLYKNLYM